MMVAVTKQEELQTNHLMRDYYIKNVDTNLSFDKKFDEDEVTTQYDKLILARNLYNLKELKKSAYILRDFSKDVTEQSCMFMHNYALYLHADMKMREERYQAEYEKSKQND
jgi:hypothetical protein